MTGYRKVASFMSRHPEVASFQRFKFMNTLNILYLQAELVELEQSLRKSMAEDLKLPPPKADALAPGTNSQAKISVASHHESNRDKFVSINEADDAKVIETGHSDPKLDSESDDVAKERLEAARDWWYLSNTEHSPTWQIMLQVRGKLQEYNKTVLRQTQMSSLLPPNDPDLKFLRTWFSDIRMGDHPLMGDDSDLWETSLASDLIALKPRKGEDPMASLFLNKVYIWWHRCLGYRFKKVLDEESQYFEYNDEHVLCIANIFSSIISAALLIGSTFALYFVNNDLIRLGLVAIFSFIFSLTLSLATNAKKIEVFAASAAFLAVQVVFVGCTQKSSE